MEFSTYWTDWHLLLLFQPNNECFLTQNGLQHIFNRSLKMMEFDIITYYPPCVNPRPMDN